MASAWNLENHAILGQYFEVYVQLKYITSASSL
jgi:hypothetical protein